MTRALCLSAALLFMMLAGPAHAEPEAVSPQLNPLADGRLGPLTALRERPLFSATRRAPAPPSAPVPEPVAAPSEVAAAPPAPAPTLRLIGIVEADGARFALVSRSGGPAQTVRLGEAVEAWTVSAIEPQSLILALGERRQSYPIFVPNPVATSVPGGNQEPL